MNEFPGFSDEIVKNESLRGKFKESSHISSLKKKKEEYILNKKTDKSFGSKLNSKGKQPMTLN